MEGGVEVSEPSLQVQVVGRLSYMLEDLEWVHSARVKLRGAWQAEVLDKTQHLVTNLELLVAMVSIIVSLLVRLCLFQLLPNFLCEGLDLLDDLIHTHRRPSAHKNIRQKLR